MTNAMLRVLRENVSRPRQTPEGWEWEHWENKMPTRLRLKRGSGIAGRGHTYSIAEVRGGHVRAAEIRTARDLYRALLELEAEADEQRPADQPGIKWYARRQHNRFGTATVWISRRVRDGTPLHICTCRCVYERTGRHMVHCPLSETPS